MEKLDLTKLYKAYYMAKTKPEIVEFGPAQYLSVTGKGDPSGSVFLEKVQALFPTAYTVKSICKAKGKDFAVPKLEGLWWFDEAKYGGYSMTEAPKKIPRTEWEYRLLIRLPAYVQAEDVAIAKASVVSKKQIHLAESIELYEMEEEKCVQMMHVGPFDTEPATLAQMQVFIEENNFIKNGLHHELYLSDFRKTAPEKLKTILREPVK